MSLKLVNDPKAHCSEYENFTFILEWLPGKRYMPGTEVELRVNNRKCILQNVWTRIKVNGIDIKWRVNGKVSLNALLEKNKNHALMQGRIPYGIFPDNPVTFEVSCIPGTLAYVNPVLSVWTRDFTANPAEEYEYIKEEGSEAELVLSPGPVEILSVVPRPAAEQDGTIRTCIVPEDRFGNPSCFVNPVEASVFWCGKTINTIIKGPIILSLPCSQTDLGILRCKVTLKASALAYNENIANAVFESGKLTVTGSPVWLHPIKGLIPVFGEIHWHTDLSGDGARKLKDAVAAGRDILNMDYLASSDHHPAGDKWKETVKVLNEANTPGEFATIFGWEASSDRGHVNFYFTNPDHPIRPGGEVDLVDPNCKTRFGGDVNVNSRPEVYMDKLQCDDFIAIPHHTNASANAKTADGIPYWTPYPWGKPVSYLRMAEIIQTRGNQEFDKGSDMWRSFFHFNGSSLQDALNMGHRLGFTGGTDNHCGWPGRVPRSSKSYILTGLWSESRTRDTVFKALYSRASWVTWDTRAIVDFRINGLLQGSEMKVEAGANMSAQVSISAEDSLWIMEIISEGKTVWRSRSEEWDVFEEVDLGVVQHSTHFYLRALQRNGGLIYASPVFVDVY